jgi:hypothetical protein
MRLLALMFTVSALVPGCVAAAPTPLTEPEVRRAFAAAGLELVRRPIGEDAWVTVLSARGADVDVQMYSAPEAARTFAESFEAFARPPMRGTRPGELPPPRRLDPPRIRRQANVLVLTTGRAPPALERRIERALARLASD